MKKLKKKISYIVKTIMAIGLLFTNIMPFSVVLAEGLEDYEPAITQNENGEDNNEKEDEVGDVNEDSTDAEEDFALEDGDDATSAVGETDDTLEATEGGEESLTEGETSNEENVTEVSFAYEVYVDDTLYADDCGLVELDKDTQKLEIVAKLSGVEATENYKFMIEGVEYTTENLLNGVVVQSLTFPGHLYGMFNLEVDGILTDQEGTEEEKWMSYVIEYGTDEDNDEALSAQDNDYVFALGVLTTTKYDEEVLRQIVSDTFPNANIEILSDSELFLSDDHDVYVWYGVVTKGDVNGDGKINEEDLKLLIKQVLGLEETTENSDVNGDGEVDELDTSYLKLMLETGCSEEIMADEDVTITAKFGEFSNPVKVGDEFTLEYIVTLSDYSINGISGLVNYDKNLLKLVNAEVTEFDLGDMNENKFLYLGEYLDLDIEIEYDEEGNIVFDEDGMPKLIINDVNYVLVKLTFEALNSGTATVSVDGVKFFDWSYYYTANGTTSIDIVIEENSPFTSITVSGYDIDLNTYMVTVPNDVMTADIEYVLANDSYSITSIVAPEELAVGENTIVVVVTDENGDEKEYTIKVTREEAKQESTALTTVNYQENTTYNDNNSEDDNKIVTPTYEDDDEIVDTTASSKDKNNIARIIVVILILLAIAGLIYLIFKDDDEETKQANKDIDRLKKVDNNKSKKVDNNKKTTNNQKSTKKGR